MNLRGKATYEGERAIDPSSHIQAGDLKAILLEKAMPIVVHTSAKDSGRHNLRENSRSCRMSATAVSIE